jgi:penicillin-binding protein 1C
MLAVLPNNPGLVHPGRKRTELKAKRDELLRRLQARGPIDDVELRLALLEPLPPAPLELPQAAPHLLETLVARDTAGVYRYESTIDAALQYSVQDIVARHADLLSLRGIDNVAALVIDNQRFDVLAYVGNSRWSVAPGSGFAIDLIHRPRSTGSVLKPLLFARMLDAGEIVPQTLIPDLPSQYAGFMPKNFDGTYRGAVPARLALARSLNVPAVRMLRRHGVDRFYDFLRQMGMSTLHRQPNEYGLTLILGGAEGTLWDLSAMYANLAHIAGGSSGWTPMHYRRPAVLVEERGATAGPAGVSVGAAWLTMETLVEVVRPGLEREWRNFRNSEKIAWKTGTSYGRRDGWAIGSNARYTVGVWAGNATGEGRPELTGVGAAAPVLFDIFNRLKDAEWFPMPEYALRPVEVCKNDGYLATGGCETERAWTPVDSHFESVSPHQQLVHLDEEGRWRVHGRCESVERMRHERWFVLPPGQEFYYRRHQTNYRPLPPFRPDCTGYATDGTDHRGPMEFLYPNTGTRVYIPIDLDGTKGRVVFEVAHRDPEATVFWHLDDRFLGATTTLHEQALDIAEGAHTLTVVDQHGNRLSRDFRVLDKRTGRADGRSQ